MTRRGPTSELPEGSHTGAAFAIARDAPSAPPVTDDGTNDHRLLDMENTIHELARRN